MDLKKIRDVLTIAKTFSGLPDIEIDSDYETDADFLDIDRVSELGIEDSVDESDWGISDDVDELQERVNGMDREERGMNISFGRLNCATRHGCSGATNCDNAYANFPG